jgi:NADH-quinone oxidoreductase subunit I
MKIYLAGIIKSLWLVLRHFIGTYIGDIKKLFRRADSKSILHGKTSSRASGLFTIEYPEEKMPVPEEFRFIPFLIYEDNPQDGRKYRCTACGTCARVCPPQCIWIKRKVDTETGKPIQQPDEFVIDIDICMNCGLCAEFCPYDAIRMDHDYELATQTRLPNHMMNLDVLSRPASYYREIRPGQYARDEEARTQKAAVKTAG